MPPKKRPRGYRTSITESLLERVLKIVTDVVDWAGNVNRTIPTLYRRPRPLRIGFSNEMRWGTVFQTGAKGLFLRWPTRESNETDMPIEPRRGRSSISWGYLQ